MRMLKDSDCSLNFQADLCERNPGGRKPAAAVQKASADAIPLNASLQTVEKAVNDEGWFS